MIGVFSIAKSCFLFLNLFSEKFRLCLQPNTSDKDLGYSKYQRLGGLAITMHKKRPELSSSCLSTMILEKVSKIFDF